MLPVSAVSDVTDQAVTLLQLLSTSGMAGACHAYRVVALASFVSRTFIACTIFNCIISHVTKKIKSGESIGYKRPYVSVLHTNRELQPKYCVFMQRAFAPYNLSSAYTLFTVYER